MKRNFFLTLVLVLFIVQTALTQIPKTLSYQGLLTDAAGIVVSDGDYNVSFALYDVPLGGTNLWNEDTTLTVSSGVFNAVLGSKNPLNIAFDKPYWLGIIVNDGEELTPRVQLTAAAYSLNSQAVRGGTNVFPSDGNVGIAVNEPDARLHIKAGYWNLTETEGDFKIGNDDYRLKIGVAFGGFGAGDVRIRAQGGTNSLILGSDTSDVLTVKEGKVGIGTRFPNETLQVLGTVHSTTGGFKFPDGTVQTSAASGSGTGNTLDKAYDEGGAGAGRTITADAGAVNIAGSGGLTVADNVSIDGDIEFTHSKIINKEERLEIDPANSRMILWDNESSMSFEVYHGSNDLDVRLKAGGENSWIGAVNKGNLGIGTQSPQKLLDVNGDAQVRGTVHSTTGGFKFPDGTVQTSAASGSGGSGNTLDKAYDEGGAGAGRTITTDAGAVNIAGSGGLTVADNVSIDGDIEFTYSKIINKEERLEIDPADSRMILWDNENSMSFEVYHGSNDLDVRLKAGGENSWIGAVNKGNLGIGTKSPQELLDVNGNLRVSRDATTDQYFNISHSDNGFCLLEKISSGDNKKPLKIRTLFNDTGMQSGETFIGFDVGDISDPTRAMTIKESGKIGIGTKYPSKELDVNGDTHVSGKITSGDANVSLPIAYAYINADASIASGTSNVTDCSWNETSKRYDITISGDNYTASDYVTVASPRGGSADGPIMISVTDTGEGRLRIYIWNLSGEKIQKEFQFVTYKP